MLEKLTEGPFFIILFRCPTGLFAFRGHSSFVVHLDNGFRLPIRPLFPTLNRFLVARLRGRSPPPRFTSTSLSLLHVCLIVSLGILLSELPASSCHHLIVTVNVPLLTQLLRPTGSLSQGLRLQRRICAREMTNN